MKIAFRLFAVLGLWLAVSAHAAPGIYSVAGPWIDDSAKDFRLETLSGGYTVATMAYGACRRVCSTSVRRIEELHALAERRHLSLNFVVFGLDAADDTPADWAQYRHSHGLEFDNVKFLSGVPAATQRIASRLGVHYWRYGEHTMHDFRIVLLSPEGTLVRSVDHFDDEIAVLLPGEAILGSAVDRAIAPARP